MLFYYQKSKNVTQTTNKIYAVYGESVLVERTIRKWFAKFSAGDFDFKNEELTSRFSTIDDDQIKTLIENNRCYTTCKLTKILKIMKTIVHKHLMKLGYANRYVCMDSAQFD